VHAAAVVARVVAHLVVVVFVLAVARSPVVLGTPDRRNFQVQKLGH
jgi:hypothetical protein